MLRAYYIFLAGAGAAAAATNAHSARSVASRASAARCSSVDARNAEEERLLAQKLDVIQDLRDKKTGPVRMLDRIATDIPDKLWLMELEERDQKVTLKGVWITRDINNIVVVSN